MIRLFAKFFQSNPIAETTTTIEPQVEQTFNQETSQEQQPEPNPDYVHAYYYHFPLWI